jgi:hypothetical protein
MSFEPNKNLMGRVERAAAVVLGREGHLTYPALLCELGVLARPDLEAWRAGRVPYLEQVIRTNLTKLARIQTAVRRMAHARGLKRTITGPKRGRRYSKTGHPFVEEEYAAYYRPIQPRLPGEGRGDGYPGEQS